MYRSFCRYWKLCDISRYSTKIGYFISFDCVSESLQRWQSLHSKAKERKVGFRLYVDWAKNFWFERDGDNSLQQILVNMFVPALISASVKFHPYWTRSRCLTIELSVFVKFGNWRQHIEPSLNVGFWKVRWLWKLLAVYEDSTFATVKVKCDRTSLAMNIHRASDNVNRGEKIVQVRRKKSVTTVQVWGIAEHVPRICFPRFQSRYTQEKANQSTFAKSASEHKVRLFG